MKKLYAMLTLLLMAMGMQATTYTVTGVAAIINGNDSWNPAATVNDMSSADGNYYTLTVKGVDLEAREYEWKIVEDHAWAKSYPQSGNNTLNIAETAKYDITYSLNLSKGEYDATATRVGNYEGTVSEKTYTVAGVPASIFGTEWDPSNADNDMTKQSDGTYQIVYTNKELAKGNVQFKVTVNHSWDEAYPSANYMLAIAEDGAYDVTITFNPTSKAVNATAEKTGTAVIEKDYFVAGTANILGADWDPSNEFNQMEKDLDGTYLLYKKAYLTAGESYEFKVVTNGSWDFASYPEGEANYAFTVESDGWYEVYFFFDPSDNRVWHELYGDAVPPYYSVAGSPELFGLEWDPQNDATRFSDNGDGTYSLSLTGLTLEAGTYEAKVCVDGLWDENYGADGVRNGENIQIVIPEKGTYTINFTFTLATKILNVEVVNTTGIEAVRNEESGTRSASVIYDLSGRKISGQPQGIIIMKGKKVVVKPA